MRKQVGVAPANATDVATKAYVDAVQAPIKWGTAIAGDLTVAADTTYTVSGTGRSITFPAAPADGAVVALVGIGYPVSYTAYAGSGDTVFNPNLGTTAAYWVPAYAGVLISYVYNATTKSWYPNSASNGIAVGGTANQILTKKSTNNYDTQWSTLGTVPAAGTIGQALVKKTATDFDTQWSGGPAPVLSFNNADKPVNDLSTTYPAGLSQWTQSNTQANTNGWPCGSNYCSILTLRASDGGNGASQWVTSTTNSVQFCYYRSGNQNGWSAWVNLGSDCGTATGTCDSSGYLVVTHGLGYTPSQVLVTPYPTGSLTSVAGSNPTVDTITSTTFRVRLATAVVVSGQSGVFGLSWIANTTRFFWQAFR